MSLVFIPKLISKELMGRNVLKTTYFLINTFYVVEVDSLKNRLYNFYVCFKR